MAAVFDILPQADHVRVEISGTREPGRYVQEMLAGWRSVAEECRRRGNSRILCLNKLTGPSPAPDAFEIAKAIPPLFSGAPARIAQVVLGDAESLRANQFAEDVTVNRGIEARNFPDERTALAWLRA